MGFAGMRIALMAGSACAVSVLAAVLMLPGSSLPTAMGLRISGAHLGHHLAPREAVLLSRMERHAAALPPRVLRAARSCQGDTRRLEAVMRRLMDGEPITVAAVGGSVTAGTGTHDAPEQRYVDRLFRWVNETFPHPENRFVNGGKGGAPSSYVHQCLEKYIPADADIVIVEFALNDKNSTKPWCGMETPIRREYEVLLRKALSFQRTPAVIALYWYSTQNHVFYDNAQDDLDILARYYGVPSLSWRDAAYHLMVAKAPGFRHEEVYYDNGHPNGHVGHRYIADMLIDLLRGTGRDMLTNAIPSDDADSRGKSAPATLQPAMLPGADAHASRCLLDDEFRAAAVSHEGWSWVNEGRHGQAKWGWVSDKTGSKLVFKVDTTTTGKTNGTVLAGVGFLTSYTAIGEADLKCRSGCKCKSKQLHGHIDDRASQTDWVFHEVDQHPECVMEVMVANRTRTDSHKFKVTSFVITDQEVSEQNVLQRTANQRVGNVLFIDGKEAGLLNNVTAADSKQHRQGKDAT